MRPFTFLADARDPMPGPKLGISSINVGGVDDLTPVVERLAGT